MSDSSDNKKILVVDDDPDLIRLLSTRLKANGFDVVAAQDGVSCMSQMRMENPDLIIMDLGIPAGDGFKSIERVRANASYSTTPIIVLTSRDASEARERAMEAGANAFFEKAIVDKQELLASVWGLLSQPTVH